jgi:predicted RNase H-like HicB family nuclease
MITTKRRRLRRAGRHDGANETGLRAARDLAGRYTVIVRFDAEGGRYVGRAVELPEPVGVGDSDAEALAATREGLVGVVAAMIREGIGPPPPGSESPRTEELRFLVSVEELARLAAAAQRQGLSVVDFVRGAGLVIAQVVGSRAQELPPSGPRRRR